MKNTTSKVFEADLVNFNNFKVQNKEIAINGVKLPFCIGNKLKIADNDKLVKTIVAISIFEDGRVSYTLEWYDPESSNFCTETVTLTELKLLNLACQNKEKNNIGF